MDSPKLNRNQTNLKIISILIGMGLSYVILEIFARLAPATDFIPFELPIKCENLNQPNINCFPRRKSHFEYTWSKGKFRPLNLVVKKKTNDIGQFSDINFKLLNNNNRNSLKVISIGDSFTEALQVGNVDSFHGALNGETTKQGKELISTALGAGGMALPNYIAYLKFVLQRINMENGIVIIPVISNDFDESFMRYGIEKRKNFRKGRGQFFFKRDSDELIFHPFYSNFGFYDKAKYFVLKRSAFARYLFHNLEISNTIKNNFFSNEHKKNSKFTANIVDSYQESDPERFEIGDLAIKKFLSNLGKLRQKDRERANTILIVSSDNYAIYNQVTPNKNSFFQVMRNKLIDKSLRDGFTVIDMEVVFKKDFNSNYKKFESPFDGHWNEYGHKIISKQILNQINKLGELTY